MADNGDLDPECLADHLQAWEELNHQLPLLKMGLLLRCKEHLQDGQEVLHLDGKAHHQQVLAHFKAVYQPQEKVRPLQHHPRCQTSMEWLPLDHMHQLLRTTQTPIMSVRHQRQTYLILSTPTCQLPMKAQSANGKV